MKRAQANKILDILRNGGFKTNANRDRDIYPYYYLIQDIKKINITSILTNLTTLLSQLKTEFDNAAKSNSLYHREIDEGKTSQAIKLEVEKTLNNLNMLSKNIEALQNLATVELKNVVLEEEPTDEYTSDEDIGEYVMPERKE